MHVEALHLYIYIVQVINECLMTQHLCNYQLNLNSIAHTRKGCFTFYILLILIFDAPVLWFSLMHLYNGIGG